MKQKQKSHKIFGLVNQLKALMHLKMLDFHPNTPA